MTTDSKVPKESKGSKGSTGPKTIKKRDSEQTRQAFLDAGLKEFAKHGFPGARADRIAKAAKRNIRMLYHYFGSKQGLYTAVLEDAYVQIRAREAELDLDEDRPLESMLALMRFTFEYFASHPYFEGLIRAENMISGRFVSRSRKVPETAYSLIQRIETLVEKGQSLGIFGEGLDARHIYVTIAALSRFHLSNTYSMSALLGVDMADKKWRAERLADCLRTLESYLTYKGADEGLSMEDVASA